MIKKIFWFLMIVVVLYTVGVFYSPAMTDAIAEKTGLVSYNNFIRSFKGTLDGVATDIPTKDELIEGGKAAYSGALDAKDKFIDGVGEAKDTIDTVRSTLSGAESTYKDAKETFDKAKDFVEGASEKIEKVKGALDDVQQLSEGITNTE